MEFLSARPPSLHPDSVASASGWIHDNPNILLYESHWDAFRNLRRPDVGERAIRLLKHLATRFPQPGQDTQVNRSNGIPPSYVAASWAMDKDEVFFLYNVYLYSKGFVTSSGQGAHFDVILPAGWDYLDQLRHVNPTSRIGFCAMWFDTSLDGLWNDAIRPAIKASGYDALRIDKHEHNNRIDDEIIANIRQSKFLVADFTHGLGGERGGVYFEAGYALGLGLEVIHTCREDMIKDSKIHFDNRQYNFITWRPESLTEFKEALQNRILATVGKGPIANELQISVGL